MTKKNKLFLIIAFVLVAVIIAVTLFAVLEKNSGIESILNKDVNGNELLKYVETEKSSSNNEFYEHYLKTISAKVTKINDKKNNATVQISAPDIEKIVKDIAQKYSNSQEKYEDIYDKFYNEVIQEIDNYNDPSFVNTITINISENGKIIPDLKFLNAMFPNLLDLLNECIS